MGHKVIMFSGKFCAPCKTAKPFVEDFCSKNNIFFDYRLVEDCDDITLDEFEIQAVPTFFLHHENNKQHRMNGWTHRTPIEFHEFFEIDLV